MLFKTTRRLFRGIYQYKIVLVCSDAGVFRSGDMAEALLKLNTKQSIKNYNDRLYGIDVAKLLINQKDLDIRVENPWISIYTNDRKLINQLAKIDESHVKYIAEPDVNTQLAEGTVVMPKMDYDYRITMGKTVQPNYSFIEWAEKSPKCKLTKSCIRDLQKPRSWGGTHFYITGDNNLLLAKMHLGGSVSKVERIVKK